MPLDVGLTIVIGLLFLKLWISPCLTGPSATAHGVVPELWADRASAVKQLVLCCDALAHPPP